LDVAKGNVQRQAHQLVPPSNQVPRGAHSVQQGSLCRQHLVDSGSNGLRGQSFARKAAVLAEAVHKVHYRRCYRGERVDYGLKGPSRGEGVLAVNMREPVDSLGEVTVATADGLTMTVGDVRTSARFEARAGGELVGYTTYRHYEGATFLVHTVTEPAWRGHGVATAMTSAVLDLIRQAGRSVIPRCPFVADFLAGHEELLGLVPAQYRHLVKPAFRPGSQDRSTTPTTDWAAIQRAERIANDYHSGD
jgi:predicted GNAT family acetyltransferase